MCIHLSHPGTTTQTAPTSGRVSPTCCLWCIPSIGQSDQQTSLSPDSTASRSIPWPTRSSNRLPLTSRHTKPNLVGGRRLSAPPTTTTERRTRGEVIHISTRGGGPYLHTGRWSTSPHGVIVHISTQGVGIQLHTYWFMLLPYILKPVNQLWIKNRLQPYYV